MPCLVDDKKELTAFIHSLQFLPETPSLIIFDTLARSMLGDENSTADMGKVVIAAGKIAEQTGAQVLIVHHTGKDESRGARGAIALTGATDTMFKTAKTDHKEVSLICERQKDDEPTPDLVFSMQTIDTGYVNRDKEPVLSLVPVIDPEAMKERKSKKKGNLKGANLIAMKALQQALDQSGEKPSDEVRTQMEDDVIAQCGVVVHEDQWREVAYNMSISDGGNGAKKKAFSRARTKLLELEKIKTWEGFYWTI